MEKETKFDIKMRFKNYKLLKDKTFDLKGHHVLIIQGPNESGKTTIRTALKEGWQAKNLTKQPLTTNEEEGFVELTIPDKNGNPVIIKHDFNKFDQVGSFTAIDSDGKVIHSPGKMRELLGNYEHLSINQIWALTQSIPGIRELQENFLSKCLTQEEREKIETIDKEIDTSNGTLFNERRLAKGEVDRLQKVISSSPIISDEDLSKINNLDTAKTNLKEIQEELSNVDLILKEREHIQERINAFVDQKNGVPSEIKRTNEYYDDRIKDNDEERANLLIKIKLLEEQNTTFETGRTRTITEYEELIKTTEKEIEIEKGKLPDEPPSRESLTERITKGETFIDNISELKIQYLGRQNNKKLEAEAAKKLTDLETKLFEKRNEKKKILANSDLPAGIEMQDNDITINGLPLRETQISETTVKLAITEIACQISEGKLIDGGSASDYGHDRLKQVAEIAGKYNKLLILEKVDDDLSDVKVVGYIYDE